MDIVWDAINRMGLEMRQIVGFGDRSTGQGNFGANVQRRFTKMINNMKGKTSYERLHCLKLSTLEERRNRQGLIEAYKMCNGLSRLKFNEFFTLDDNIMRTRCHS